MPTRGADGYALHLPTIRGNARFRNHLRMAGVELLPNARRKSSTSERQEIYRYAVEKEHAAQQQNMTNGVFDTVRPHLEGAAQAIERKTPGFLAALQAFLAEASDPTDLKLYHLRQQAHDLKRNVEEVSGLLAQIAGKQEEPS